MRNDIERRDQFVYSLLDLFGQVLDVNFDQVFQLGQKVIFYVRLVALKQVIVQFIILLS